MKNTKKRIVYFIIVLALVFSMLPFSIYAATTGSASISLSKNVYIPNEEIFVTVSGITQEMMDNNAYVATHQKDAGHDEYIGWNYPKVESGQIKLLAPAELGSYEMRLYNKDGDYTNASFVMSVPFTFSLQKQGKISLDKSAYQAMEPILVTVTEITKEMEEAHAFVSIYKKNAKHEDYMDYMYPEAGNSTLKMMVPNENGEFEMRLYSIEGNYTDESFVMSVPFTVSGAQKSSDWAKTEIEKATELGLIPASLLKADLTKPISRAEFCEIALLLYEKSTGISPEPVSPNPFTDTSNPQILKAFALGITQGTSATTFSPDVLINREQCATMLYRAIKAIEPEGDYSIAGVADFPDQKDISSYAVEPTKFMSKLGIIKGDDRGNFMPKATTTAQTAAGYGMATREAAILMSVRSYEKMDEI